jgi:hypothetical protein
MSEHLCSARRAIVVFCSIGILQLAVPLSAQTVLPAPWASRDVGAPALAGSATENNGAISVNAAGTDIWGTSDQFHFVYQLLTGDGAIAARVDSLGATDPWAKAGLMIRETLNGNSKNIAAVVTAGNGLVVQGRTTTGGTSISHAGGAGKAPYWLIVQRVGDQFHAYASLDAASWRYLGTLVISMPPTVYVGLAATSHRATSRTTAVFSDVQLDGADSNQGPSVQITAPASGATFTSPAAVAIAASASDPDGTVAKVEFYQGSTLIGSDTTAPFSASWNVSTAGTYALSAKAIDNAGASTQSAPVNVTVSTAPSSGPYGGTPAALPGTVQAENFDEGGKGIAYHDTSAGNSGGKYRSTDVDIETTTDTGGGFNVAWVSAGEWLQYTVNVTTAGSYTLEARVACSGSGGTFHVEVNGANVSGTMTVPNTGGWQQWQTVSKTVTLAAGVQRIRLVMDATGSSGAVGNFNHLKFTQATSPAPTTFKAVFTASADHATLVQSYRLDIFSATASPATATPLKTLNLGKPAPVSGEITVDITSTVSSLAAGSYIATVTAIGANGSGQSQSASFVR